MIKTRLVILADLAEPPAPALEAENIVLIECSDDRVISDQGRATMRARYPGSRVHALQGGGHFPYVTRAKQYNAIIAASVLGET